MLKASKLKKVSVLILSILLLDQISKIYIKTNFELEETIKVFNWFHILFVENDGMAWGAKLNDFIPFISDGTSKLILTTFRILAVSGIGYWLYHSLKYGASRILTISLSLIFAGALGNIIDSVFYGMFFGDSYGNIAQFLENGINWNAIGRGRVVDMLHFPIWKGYLPEWIPYYGGDYFIFFKPVFNIADITISLGVGILLMFNKKAFSDQNS